ARALGLAAVAMPEVDLVFHPQCFLSEGHFAGSDAVRAAAFLEVANDPAFDAIWFARGGYGSNRILHSVMPQLGEAARRKTYLGFSDMGFLLGALYAAK
ncbi:LD-carboxypeptidase, partial [Klebsiella pneumoniae]